MVPPNRADTPRDRPENRPPQTRWSRSQEHASQNHPMHPLRRRPEPSREGRGASSEVPEVRREVPGRAVRRRRRRPVASPVQRRRRETPNSTLLLSSRSSLGDLPVMPTTGGGDLRESFDLPMMTESAPARPPRRPSAGRGRRRGGRRPGPLRGRRPRPAARRPAPRRGRRPAAARPAAASSRSGCRSARHAGSTWRSGARVDLTDDLSPPPPPPAAGPADPDVGRRRPLPGGERGADGPSPCTSGTPGGRGDLFRPARPVRRLRRGPVPPRQDGQARCSSR